MFLPCFLFQHKQSNEEDNDNGIKKKLMMQADLNAVLSSELGQEDLGILKGEAFRTLGLCASDPDQSWFTSQMLISLIKDGKIEVTAEESTKFLESLAIALEKASPENIPWHTLYSYCLLLKKLVPLCPSSTLILNTLEKLFNYTTEAVARSNEKHTPFLVESIILSASRKVLLSARKIEPDNLSACLRILCALPKMSSDLSAERKEDCALLGGEYPMYREMCRKCITLSTAIALNDSPDGAFFAVIKSLPFLQGSIIGTCIEDDKDVVNLLSDSLALWYKMGPCDRVKMSLFDPVVLFVKFSELIFFDPDVLRDLIVGSKGAFLEFLVKFLKLCTECPERFTEELSRDADSLSLFVRMLNDLKEREFEFNISPLKRRIDYLIRIIGK